MSKIEQFRKNCKEKLRLDSKVRIPESVMKKETFMEVLPFEDGTFRIIDLKQFDPPSDGSKTIPYIGVQGKNHSIHLVLNEDLLEAIEVIE